MDSKAVLAVVLSVIVLIGFQWFYSRQAAQAPAPQVQEAPKESPDAKAAQATGSVARDAKGAPATPQDIPEKVVRIDTPLYYAELSTKGAVIRKWDLKKYTEKGMPVPLLKQSSATRPLSVGRDTDFGLKTAVFTVSGDLTLSPSDPEGVVVLEHRSGDVTIRRTMKFSSSTYRVDVTDEIKGGDLWLALGSDFGITAPAETGTHSGPVVLDGTSRDEFEAEKLKESRAVTAKELKWIAQEDKYFFSAIVPPKGAAEVRLLQDKDVTSLTAVRLKEGTSSYVLYAGPKVIDELKALNLGLEHVVDFGWFSIIARPLFWMLTLIHRFIGNWGWAIIILTIILRIPFIPLMNKGSRSMKKLQELQPRMQEIRERYKKDPQRMQREMMELYRKYKVNPMSGCLPMLIQIPFFFALYKVLLISIELRQAPFMFWVRDLAEKDPYYVLPIVMGATMFIQQKMTPSTADPTQAKIMLFLPVIFTFMFLNFPSGLVLYWLMTNVLSIIQQYFVNRSVARESGVVDV